MTTNYPTPAAGWYDDPTGPGLRYWNGQAWTNQTQPAQFFVQPQVSQATPNYSKPWTGGSTVLVILTSGLALLAPLGAGLWGFLIGLLAVLLTVIVVTKDFKKATNGTATRKYWSETRAAIVVVFFNILVFVPWILAIPLVLTGIIYFIVTGILHGNNKESN